MREYLNHNKPYLIAETAYAFEGDTGYLLNQTLNLPQNVNAIKYHILFDIDDYIVEAHSLYDKLKQWLLCEEDWIKILKAAKGKKLDTIVLADDISTIELCERNSELVDAVEIHAACINDLKLFDRAITFSKNYDKVFVLGISGFEIQELLDISEYLRMKDLSNVLMMYGFQNYPTSISNINLSKIPILEKILGYKIGYADHTSFNEDYKESIIYSSFALGANIQEVHYVLEEGVERIDYSTAIGPKRLKNIKEMLEKLYSAIGNPDMRLNMGEKKYLDFRKVPVSNTKLDKGDIFENKNLFYKRVEFPQKQHKFREEELYIGKKVQTNIEPDTELLQEFFEEN